MKTSAEQWRPCPGFEDLYEVSSEGRIRRSAPACGARVGHVLRDRPLPSGYRQVMLSRGGRGSARYVHTLTATAFHGPPPSPAHEVNHRNGDKADNRAANLEWMTRGENMRHAYRTGLRNATTERKPTTKLTEADVIAIRARYQPRVPGHGLAALAAEFGICERQVWAIAYRRAWRHVA